MPPVARGLCAIHQPNFFPRLSTLAKIYTADRWIVLDDVQFVRRDYQHRARLASLDRSTHQWLSLPVHLPHGRATPISEVTVAEARLGERRTFGMIQQHYGRSSHWPLMREPVLGVACLLTRTDSLTAIAVAATKTLLQAVGWKGEILSSSSFSVRAGRSARLADLTAASGSDRYLCGEGGSRYLDAAPFRPLGVDVDHFVAPRSSTGIWADARFVSALWAFMTIGPQQLRVELDTVSRRWQPH